MSTEKRAGLLAVVLVALLIVPGWELAAKETWNLNMFGGKRAMTRGIEVMSETLAKESDGQFDIKVHYGSALGPEKQAPESIKIGAYEAAQVCVGYYPAKFPLLSVMELPFLAPRDLRQRQKVEKALMEHPAIQAEMGSRWNIEFLSHTLLPAYEFMGNRRIEKVEDLKGVKMRIAGLNAKALEVFGAVPTMVTAPEGYQALDRGTIDMFGFPWTYAFGAYKLYEVSKYATDGLGMSGFMCFQGVSSDAMARMPANLKQRLPDLRKEAVDAMLSAYEVADKKWYPEFRKKNVEIVTITPAVRDQLVKGSRKFWAEWAKDQDDAGRQGTKMLEFVQEQISKASM